MSRLRWVLFLLILLSACNLKSEPQNAFHATLPADEQNAPIFTPTFTPTSTTEATFTPTETFTPEPTSTPEFTPTASNTPLPTSTPDLTTPLPVSAANAPSAYQNPPADFSPTTGWSCDDFPCADDIAGWLERIRVPAGYTLEFVGRFPGQPMQITYDIDGRLYATVLENGSRYGAIHVMNADGSTERYFPTNEDRIVSPVGLAFQPGTDVLYVSARIELQARGRVWQIQSDHTATYLPLELPCCFSLIDNQPNGLIFGMDGYLYMGVGSLTDHLEPPDPRTQQYGQRHPNEAAVLRIHPHTGELTVFASGIRNPYDLTMDSTGQFYATDNGMITGPGDRLLKLTPGGNYGWPYWRDRGCDECPVIEAGMSIEPDLLRFSNYTLPRGLTAYTGTQFPSNVFDNLFVALWGGTPDGQRIVRIDPNAITDPAQPFVTGLLRPVDVVVAPDGTLIIADFIYGHIWRVRYTGVS